MTSRITRLFVFVWAWNQVVNEPWAAATSRVDPPAPRSDDPSEALMETPHPSLSTVECLNTLFWRLYVNINDCMNMDDTTGYDCCHRALVTSCIRPPDQSGVSVSCQSWRLSLFLYHQITDSNQTDQKHLNKHQWHENDLKRQKPSLTNIYLTFTLSFDLSPCPIHWHGGGGVCDLYCSRPLGGDPDVLASLPCGSRQITSHLNGLLCLKKAALESFRFFNYL